MPIITFWSNSKKTIGQTVSASIAATVMAMEHNYKVLLISADINDTSIEDCFGSQESNKDIVNKLVSAPRINLDSGIKGLMKLADSKRVTPDIIHDYTKIIFKNRLEVLYSPTNIADGSKQNVFENFKNIIINAARYYDQVIVDLKKGISYSQQLEILEMSDIIVENIEQGTKTINEFLTVNETKKILNKDNVIWNICKYDKSSKYNIKNLTRNILKRQKVYGVPYNTLVLDASQEGNLVELIIRFRTLKLESENLEFFTQAKELVEGILLKYQETRMRL